MNKRIMTLIGTLAIGIAAFSMPVYAKGKDLSFVLPDKIVAGQGFTSLKFSAEVKNVSENAKVSVDFGNSIPEKTVKKTTYKDGILTVYLAGGEELFPDNTLEIGEITVKNDENNGKNLYVELLPETVEIVNSGYTVVKDIDAEREEIKLTGSGTEAPEIEKPDPGDPDPETPQELDTTKLNALLEELKVLNPQDYTQESWNALSALMEQASELVKNDKVSQEQINNMITQLNAAKENLQPVSKLDTTKLNALLEELKGMDPQIYTQESWNTVAALIEQAEELLKSGTASQEQIDNMFNQLKTAKENLQPGTLPSPDPEQARQNLQTLMDELNNLLSSEYTAESWNELYALMKKANSLLENGASKAEYDAMTAKLIEAKSKLVKAEGDPAPTPDPKPTPGGGSISGEEVNTQKPQNPIKDTIQGVLTGDNTPVVALALVGILSLAVILGILFSKKMQKK